MIKYLKIHDVKQYRNYKAQYFCCITVNAALALFYPPTCPPHSGSVSLLLMLWILTSSSKEWLEADCILSLPQPMEYLIPSAKCSIRVDTREAVCLSK